MSVLTQWWTVPGQYSYILELVREDTDRQRFYYSQQVVAVSCYKQE